MRARPIGACSRHPQFGSRVRPFRCLAAVLEPRRLGLAGVVRPQTCHADRLPDGQGRGGAQLQPGFEVGTRRCSEGNLAAISSSSPPDPFAILPRQCHRSFIDRQRMDHSPYCITSRHVDHVTCCLSRARYLS